LLIAAGILGLNIWKGSVKRGANKNAKSDPQSGPLGELVLREQPEVKQRLRGDFAARQADADKAGTNAEDQTREADRRRWRFFSF
jgi:hypothetical protein